MHILLASKHIASGRRPIGGVQSWNTTVRKELERLGHTVWEWEPTTGLPRGSVDLGIIANARRTAAAVNICDKVINVSHGIIPDEEPMPGVRTFYVSEGVRKHWGGRGDILRQPIDLDFWKPGTRKRTGVVRFSYRPPEALCEAATRRLGTSYAHIQDASPEEARDALQAAHVVFASGRAALEAMACGARVVIYDHRLDYQRPLLGSSNLRVQMENSYSGRGGVTPSLDMLVDAARSAKPMRHWVEKYHDARKIVGELLG